MSFQLDTAGPSATLGVASLLTQVLAQPVGEDEAVSTATPESLFKAIVQALGTDASLEDIARVSDVLVARLEQMIERQANAILHHPRFQALEASWRGVMYLCEQAGTARQDAEDTGEDLRLKLKLLQLSKKELAQDLSSAIEFDQSKLYKFVYEGEYGTVGGEPYGALIGDYEFTNHRADIETLGHVSQVAAAAFAP
ncbi:MAG TPA: type VI secretion system contractile sheath large subunit, partial [Pirellulaceae bacterium]|nr:type VI secretion system contractile sheath large subunit [Pirellulaceae bacterium]